MSESPRTIRAFAPATVSNVGCGFDVFGFAVEGLGDVVEARTRPQPGVEILDVQGDGGLLPRSAERNTAGIAVLHLVKDRAAEAPGVELTLHKGMPLASGLGSSAASAVAAVTAANALLRLGRSKEDLLRCVLEAERSACGSAHGDNAAPSLYGGFIMVRGAGDPSPRVDALPVADDLYCALLHPHVAVETGAARALLGDRVPLAAAIRQWGNTAALTAGLFRDDDELLASALEDAIAEPLRSGNVPGFADIKQAALDHGALGAGLSGSGPTLFALCRGRERARQIADAMARALEPHGVEGDTLVSPVGAPGARVLATGESPSKEGPCAT